MKLVMLNGDHITGMPRMASLPIRTPFARIEIPIAQVMTITMANDRETASAELANGDRLTGVPDFNSVELMTGFEKVAIDVKHIRVIRVVEVNVPTPGRTRTVDLGSGVSLDLLPIPAGSFRMGSNDGSDDEKPVRTVRIMKAFWMGKFEVTQAQWRSVMGDAPSRLESDNLPVDSVSWRRCVDFCRKLTDRGRAAGLLPSGYVYRLPTEAEWEYAARGGAKSQGYTYSGGNDFDAVGWSAANSDGRSHRVGHKRANELDLHDMSGNVWEWCLDWYQDSYSGLDDTDPKGPKTGWNHGYRGGSWSSDSAFCRPAYRRKDRPSVMEDYLGFRVVLAPAP